MQEYFEIGQIVNTSGLKGVIKVNPYTDDVTKFEYFKKVLVEKKKAPFYHIVVADSRRARDGRIIEQIGTYDPMTDPSTVELNKELVEKWIKNGAKPTDTVKRLIDEAK